MTQQSDTQNTVQLRKKPVPAGTRHGRPTYTENPYITELISTSRTRNKRYKITAIDQFSAELVHTQEVEANKFIKLYANHIKTLFNLSAPALKVFLLLNDAAWRHNTHTKINHAYGDIDQQTTPLSRSTYQRGITDLLNANIIQLHTVINTYWLDPTVAFNGDRLTVINEYIKTK